MHTLLNRSLVIIAIAFINLQIAYCQQQPAFTISTYDETNGLKSNIINVLLQDSKGFIWIGTTDGLYRYDGYNFKIFKAIKKDTNSLAGNYITRLAEDKEGNIWIGLQRGGISCYLPSKNSFKNYPVNISNSNTLSPTISMLYIDNNNDVWVGFNQEGLIKLDKQTKKMQRINIVSETDTFFSKEYRKIYNTAFAMYQQKQNVYWLATYDGLYRFNSATMQMTPVREKPLLTNEGRNDLFTCIVADSNGIWMGSWAGGLTYYNISTNTWSNYKYSKPIKNIANTNIIENIQNKNGNELWLSSADGGLGIFNKTTHGFYFLNNDSTYRSHIQGVIGTALLQDDQNNLWLTVDRQLIKLQFTEKKFVFNPITVTRSDNGAYYDVTCMLADRSNTYLIIGTSLADGLHLVNRQTGHTKTLSFKAHSKEENSMRVVSLFQDTRGLIWVLTRDYIYQLNLQHEQLIQLAQPEQYTAEDKSNFYTSIGEDAKGNIWISSARNGVFCYDVTQSIYTHFYKEAKEDHLPSNNIRTLAVDGKGRVWVGNTNGVFGYFDAGKRFIQLDESAKETAKLTDKKMYDVYADRHGNIWAGTDAGLYYYTTDKTKPEWKKTYTSEDGLPGDFVYNVFEDNYGYMWCITLFSLYRINTKLPGVEMFSKLDGINTNTTANGLYSLPDGTICLFSTGGYYTFHPASFKEKAFNIPLVITSFKIDDNEQNYAYNDSAHTIYTIPAAANVFSFEFAALDFYRPDKQEYAYMLEGYDKDWIMAGQRRYVSYSNIPGGNYVFKVKATNNPGAWNTGIVSIPLYIKTPFYKTFWFILLVVAVIVYALYYIYRYKLAKQQQILQLETKAQMLGKEKTMAMYETLKQHLNPHFLFNSLTSLSSLIRYDQDKAVNFLNGLSKIYRYILKSRDTETVSLKEELQFVQHFIQLQQTRFNTGLVVDISIDEQYYAYKIVPVTLQNLIENAIKHNIIDEDEPLTISIYIEEDYLVVQNNLQKKSFVETSNQQGLHNMRSLYAYLTLKPVTITEDENYYTIKIPLV